MESKSLGDAKLELRELDARRAKLEEKMKALIDSLEKGGCGISGSLVDEEGYPRSDVDLYLVRSQRHELNCLRTDHRVLRTDIEQKLLEVVIHSLSSGYYLKLFAGAFISAWDRA